jgi:hypothetical protein
MDLTKRIEKTPVGGYTGYLRHISEPCTIDPVEADVENMEFLGVSKFNLLKEKLSQYVSKR